MINNLTRRTWALFACFAVAAMAAPMPNLRHSIKSSTRIQVNKGMAVAYPWVFEKGHDTSKTTATTSVEEILSKANYAPISNEAASAAWLSSKLPTPSFGNLPTRASLLKFGRAVRASKVLYGSVSWHTRSIWVNLGPKTISTATVSVYVFDVASGKVVFKKLGILGRSDEKSNGYKIAAAILITPLVTAVSGGPATPQEQRAVQIALGKAYSPWVKG